MRTFRVIACLLFALAAMFAFGWLVDKDAARAVGFIAAGCLLYTLSTIEVARVP